MPLPKPKHQPNFTEEQLSEAHRLAAKRSAPGHLATRARLTLALAEHPEQSHEEIAAACGLHRDTVYKWRRRWTTEGWSLKDAHRSGRPRIFSP